MFSSIIALGARILAGRWKKTDWEKKAKPRRRRGKVQNFGIKMIKKAGRRRRVEKTGSVKTVIQRPLGGETTFHEGK